MVTETAPLSVIAFPGSNQWPVWVARDQGIDAAHGIRLEVHDTRDSRQQMTGLVDGDYDVAITAFDNVVAYHEGVGSPYHPPAPVIAVMGLDAGMLSLVATSEFDTVADLKGRELSVDAMTTGYAFTLRETLHRAGLQDRDYTLVSTGGAKQRYEDLVAGQYAATVLMPPFTAMAQQQGLRRLADISNALGHYQGGVVAVRSDWADGHPALATGYLAAHLEALAWLYDPENRAAAIAIYRRHLATASPEAAAEAYTLLIDPVNGFWRDGRLDKAGIAAVLDMRRRYGPAGCELGPVDRYIRTDLIEKAGNSPGDAGGRPAPSARRG